MFSNGKYGFVGEELHRGLHTALLCLRTAQSLDVQIACRDIDDWVLFSLSFWLKAVK